MPHGKGENTEHVIYNEMPEKIEFTAEADFMSFWEEIHELRDEVKKALEPVIKEKTIKSSLEAKVTLSAGGEKLAFLRKAESELAAAFIVSEVEIKDNGGELSITVEKAEGEDVQETRHRLPDPGRHG